VNDRTAIYEKWLSELEKRLVDSYNKSGLRASGEYEKQLESYVKSGVVEDHLIVLGAYHSQFMADGRNPTRTTTAGSPTLKEIILKWIDVKGIVPRDGISKGSLAFLIARKIHREGIKVPNPNNDGNVISDALRFSDIDELVRRIGIGEANAIRSDIINALT